MVAPGLVGFWLDRRSGLTPLLTVVGFSGGLALGMWHLLRMSSSGKTSDQQPPPSEP
jgi:hypothetical protein